MCYRQINLFLKNSTTANQNDGYVVRVITDNIDRSWSLDEGTNPSNFGKKNILK